MNVASGFPGERDMARLRIAVVGVGHLGKEHARILAGLGGVELVGVVDVNAEQAQAVARRVGCRAYADCRAVLPLVDAASVVVPTAYHYAVAGEFLRHGIPLLIEKPMAASVEQADALLNWALQRGLSVTAGPLVDFSPAQLPAWLWLWERDLPSMATFMCRFVESAGRRYRTRIRRWHLTAGSTLHGSKRGASWRK